MSKQSTNVTFRCPDDLLKQLREAAEGESPANTLSREIVERLYESFAPPDADREREQFIANQRRIAEEVEKAVTAAEQRILQRLAEKKD